MIGSGIGALVVALGAVVTYLTQMQSVIDTVNRYLGAMGAVIQYHNS